MKIFLAGASGAIGKSLVPQLVAAGHEVTGRPPPRLSATGCGGRRDGDRPRRPGPRRRGRSGHRAPPDVVVHQATGLAGIGNPRKMAKEFELTNRLRTEGTDNLLEAAGRVGARVVAQSFAGWPYAREGGPVKDEEAPLDPNPPAAVSGMLDAIKHLEESVVAADGIVLRYGGFYGPGTGFDSDGPQTQAVRKRQFPIVGEGGGVWSLIHIDDAASATVAAIERGAPGLYNVVDDEPAPVREFCRCSPTSWGQAAAPPSGLAGAVGRRRAHGGDAHRHPRGVEREGQARAGLGASRPTWREGFKELGAGASPG